MKFQLKDFFTEVLLKEEGELNYNADFGGEFSLLLEEIIQQQLFEFISNNIRFHKDNHNFEILRGDYLEDFIQDLVQWLYSFGYLKLGIKSREQDVVNIKIAINKMVQRIINQIETSLEYEFKRIDNSSQN